jgi:hypothetical protein
MDDLLKTKEEIFNHLKKRFESGSVKQTEIVELHQDLQRANHNIKHIIRGNVNPVGRYLSAAVGGLLAYFFVSTKFPRNSGRLLPAVVGIAPIVIGSYLFYRLGVYRFSSQGDAGKNIAMYEKSLIIDQEFKDLIKTYKKRV